MPSLKEKKHYDYSDYCSWDDSERWELIEGIPYAMSPAPLEFHQRISGELYFQLKSFLLGKSCNAYYAPFDVRLNADQEDNTVVQPDLVVICDFTKVDRRGCKGAPDLVIEILSDSTAQRDLFVKLNLYLKQEYGNTG
jgi:Uma2 family endonuclease